MIKIFNYFKNRSRYIVTVESPSRKVLYKVFPNLFYEEELASIVKDNIFNINVYKVSFTDNNPSYFLLIYNYKGLEKVYNQKFEHLEDSINVRNYLLQHDYKNFTIEIVSGELRGRL